jgi:hypothetical protein
VTSGREVAADSNLNRLVVHLVECPEGVDVSLCVAEIDYQRLRSSVDDSFDCLAFTVVVVRPEFNGLVVVVNRYLI